MIVKPYTPRRVTDVRLKAGVAAEKQMAHYLDRHFRDSKRFYVLHDVRFEHLGDNAQVDHLVIHPFGIAIVESKSVASAVRINARDEWERRQGRGWVGMANPLLQAERQGKLLKSLLKSREPDLLDKVLGLAQGTFSMMAVDTYAAISDKGRIERYDISQAPKALKADAVPSAIEDAVAGYRRASSLLTLNVKAIVTAPRDFNAAEQFRIARFMEAMDRRWRESRSGPGEARPDAENEVVTRSQVHTADHLSSNSAPTPIVHPHACKHCGSQDLEAKIGSYGPYTKCRSCGKNTSVRVKCESCKQKVYLRLASTVFSGTCETCGVEHRIHVMPA